MQQLSEIAAVIDHHMWMACQRIAQVLFIFRHICAVARMNVYACCN